MTVEQAPGPQLERTISLRLPEEDHARLAELAWQRRMSLSALVRQAIGSFVDRDPAVRH